MRVLTNFLAGRTYIITVTIQTYAQNTGDYGRFNIILTSSSSAGRITTANTITTIAEVDNINTNGEVQTFYIKYTPQQNYSNYLAIGAYMHNKGAQLYLGDIHIYETDGGGTNSGDNGSGDGGDNGDNGEPQEPEKPQIPTFSEDASDNVTKDIPYNEAIYDSSDYKFSEGWREYHDNGTSNWWVGYTTGVRPHGVHIVLSSKQFDANAMYASPKFHLQDGKNYVITFEAATSAEAPERLSLNKLTSRTNPYVDKTVLLDLPELQTGGASDWQLQTYKWTQSGDEDVWFAFHCTSPKGSKHIYVREFKIYEAIDVESDGKHGYVVKSNGSHDHEALRDEEATHYDITAVTTDSGEALNMFEVANTNALVIFCHEASHMQTNANRVTKQADGSLKAESVKIEAEKPFHFGKDVEAQSVEFSRQKGAEPRQYVTMVLPFEFDNNGEGVSVLRGLNVEGNLLQFVSFTDATVPAYTPFLYNANASDIALTGKNLKAAEKQDDVVIVELENSDWKAAYVTEKMVKNVSDDVFADYEVYYISEDAFWHATGSLTLHPFRTFFLCPKSSAPARVGAKLNFFIDGDVPTGLEDMYLEQGIESTAPAYGLDGLRVGEEHRGVTIQNGKKSIRR